MSASASTADPSCAYAIPQLPILKSFPLLTLFFLNEQIGIRDANLIRSCDCKFHDQSIDPVARKRLIRVGTDDAFEFDKAPESLDFIQMDPNIVPEEQLAPLLDDAEDAVRSCELIH